MPETFPRVHGPSPGVSASRISDTFLNRLAEGLENRPTYDEIAVLDVITPGSPGDSLGTTSAGEIGSLRPGRIDARVRGLSTSDSGAANKTLLTTLVTEAATNGAELWIPEGTYRGIINAATNLKVNGRGTLKAPDADSSLGVFRAAGTVNNWSLEGVTLDGNAIMSGAMLGSSASLLDGFRIHGVTVQNTLAGTTTHKTAGVAFIRVANGSITNCFFDGTHDGVHGYSASNVLVAGNRGENLTRHFIKFLIDTTLVATVNGGRNIVVANNVGENIAGMGVEIWSNTPQTEVYDAPILTGNQIALTGAASAYGMSLAACKDGVAQSNVLRSLAAQTGVYGIEAVGPGMTYDANTIIDFQVGLILNSHNASTSNRRSVVTNNKVHNAWEGINFASVYNGTSTGRFSGNRIWNPRDYGFRILSSTAGLQGRNEFSDNLVWRETAWSGDGTRTFNGFSIGRQDGFSRFHRNRVVQANASPTAGLVFNAYSTGVSSGQMASSEFIGNIAEALSETGITFRRFYHTGGAPANVSDADMQLNKYINASGTVVAANAWA